MSALNCTSCPSLRHPYTHSPLALPRRTQILKPSKPLPNSKVKVKGKIHPHSHLRFISCPPTLRIPLSLILPPRLQNPPSSHIRHEIICNKALRPRNPRRLPTLVLILSRTLDNRAHPRPLIRLRLRRLFHQWPDLAHRIADGGFVEEGGFRGGAEALLEKHGVADRAEGVEDSACESARGGRGEM
jgi:hypothetical protein